MYALLVARFVWGDLLSHKRCIYFIDNNSSMEAFVKGTPSSRVFRTLLVSFERLELSGPTWAWFSRVPSESNIADGPSRGDLELVLQLGATCLKPLCPVTGLELCPVS